MVKKLNDHGIGVILNFSEEHIFGSEVNQKQLDKVAETICSMFKVAKKNPMNTMAIKMTGLVDPDLFEKLNAGQRWILDIIEDLYKETKYLRLQEINEKVYSSLQTKKFKSGKVDELYS